MLLLLEPKVTAPGLYRNLVAKEFGLVLAPSSLWDYPTRRLQTFPWPIRLPDSVQPFPQEKFGYDASLIAANKFSAIAGELYSLRRSIVSLANSMPVSLAVVGRGWGGSAVKRLQRAAHAGLKAAQSGAGFEPSSMAQWSVRPREHVGFIAEKRQALGLADTTLVVENSLDYVSEKLFDAILAGVIPIYVGPTLAKCGMHDDVAIQVPPDPRAVLEAIGEAKGPRGNRVRVRGQEWLASEGFAKHADEIVLANVARAIADQLMGHHEIHTEYE